MATFFRATFWQTLILLALLSIGLFLLTLPNVYPLRYSHPQRTAFMRYRQQQALAKGEKLRIRQYWVSYQQIPELLKKTVRITEDASFFTHGGIDFNELKQAVKANITSGSWKRGASTITQQLAKNLYLGPQKNLFRKLREYFIARRLERTLSKRRIFHLYLNVIELGKGIFGVEAAARYYFKRHVWQLTAQQIIRLTAVIPRPLTMRPTANHPWLKWRCRWITRKLFLYGYISKQQKEKLTIAFR